MTCCKFENFRVGVLLFVLRRFRKIKNDLTKPMDQGTAILACIHINWPGGRLIQPRITVHVTFSRFSQYSDDGVRRITSRLA